MTKHVVVAVRDSAIQAFGPPMLVPAVGAGLRMFSDQVNKTDGSSNLSVHPEDFELWQLGVYEDETGQVDQSGDSFRVLARGKDVSTK